MFPLLKRSAGVVAHAGAGHAPGLGWDDLDGALAGGRTRCEPRDDSKAEPLPCGAEDRFPVLLDSKAEVSLMYEVRATPTVYLVDRRGKLVASAVGARPWDSLQGRTLLQELLAVK